MHRDNFEHAMGAKGNIDYCINYLKQCMQHEFPDLVKERRIHAFRNCIYITSVQAEDGTFQKMSHTISFLRNDPASDEILCCMTIQSRRNRDSRGLQEIQSLTHEVDMTTMSSKQGRHGNHP